MSKHFRIKLFLVFISVFVLFLPELKAQSVPVISKPELAFKNDSLIIIYHFINCRANQQFRVWLDVTTVEGKKLIPKTLSGDIGNNVMCGQTKKIYWNMAADSIFLDDVIYVKVFAETTVMQEVSGEKGNGKYFFASLLFPGSGLNLKKGNNKPYWLMGIVGYGGVATTLYFNQMAKTAHNNYVQETDQTQKADYLQDYNDNKKYMKISAISSGTVWLANLIWTLAAPNSEPGKVSLGNKNLQLETTVMTDAFIPGLTLKYNF
ncbi:MAG: hypothetical protein J7K46_10625 [Bacteroidales bacterium]|nr:hypothetical protein [Bacteroidales bacterium]